MINFFFFLLLFFGVSDNFTLSPLGVPPAVRWNLKGLTCNVVVLENILGKNIKGNNLKWRFVKIIKSSVKCSITFLNE